MEEAHAQPAERDLIDPAVEVEWPGFRGNCRRAGLNVRAVGRGEPGAQPDSAHSLDVSD
jgi:hypothetical protein